MISGNDSVNLTFTPFNCSLTANRYELIYHQLHPDNSPTALKSFPTRKTGNVSRCRICGFSKFTYGYESTCLVSRPNTPSITGCLVFSNGIPLLSCFKNAPSRLSFQLPRYNDRRPFHLFAAASTIGASISSIFSIRFFGRGLISLTCFHSDFRRCGNRVVFRGFLWRTLEDCPVVRGGRRGRADELAVRNCNWSRRR